MRGPPIASRIELAIHTLGSHGEERRPWLAPPAYFTPTAPQRQRARIKPGQRRIRTAVLIDFMLADRSPAAKHRAQ